jgi:hypothetical protein
MLLKFVLAHDQDITKAGTFFIKMTYERRLLKVLHCLLCTAYCALLTVHCLLYTAYCALLTVHYLLYDMCLV